MNVFFAFLRGINVGGHNIIKMQDLREMLVLMGYKAVKTYIQSGNLKFETNETDVIKIKNKIEIKLKEKFNYSGCVMIRSLEDLNMIHSLNVFDTYKNEDRIKLYICFTDRIIVSGIKIPFKQEKEALEIIKIIGNNVFVLSFPFKDRYGFPNNFVEKEFGVLSTARNWNIVCKMINN